jgi:hypothetical protein
MERLLPRLCEFAPDLLLFSAGFDAHYDDMYHYLDEDDIHWLTTTVAGTAKRVVSVLEGGYSLEGGSQSIRPRKGKGSSVEDSTEHNYGNYAVLPGDGGLVRGVLAHVSALSTSRSNIDLGERRMQGI